jgi:L-ascorbate metabolism protein UlaG (beta-lactamase superfamily)
MEITWLGHSCFRVKGKERTLITDPYQEGIGYSWAMPTANIVTVSHSHPGHSNSAGVNGDPRVINRPGEYEVGGVFVIGLGNYHDSDQGASRGKNISYLFEIDDIKLCHLGDIGHVPSARQVEEFSGVDILIVPVGGISTIDGKAAADIAKLLNPKIVVPMHYRTEVVTWLEPLDRFTTQLGLKDIIPQLKLSISKASIPLETKTVILDRSSS